MFSIRVFLAIAIPALALGLVVVAADLATGFRYRLVGHFRVAWSATALRMKSNWASVPTIIINKYYWFFPILIMIFAISPILGLCYLIYDVVTVFYLIYTQEKWVQLRDGRKAAFVHAQDSEIEIALTDARDQEIEGEDFIQPEQKWYRDQTVVVQTTGWTLTVSDYYNALDADLRARIDFKHLVITKDNKKFFVNKTRTAEFPVAGPYPTPAEYEEWPTAV